MIDYIHTQLAIWGRWSANGAKKDIGYSPVCPMFKDARHGGAYGSAPPPGVGTFGSLAEILDMDAAVNRLGREHKTLAIEFYVIGGRAIDIAERRSVTKKALYEQLHSLQQAVLGHLNDVVAEV